MDQATRKFTADVHRVVRKAMPGLIASEMSKLQAKRSSARSKPRTTSSDTSETRDGSLAAAVKQYGSKRAAAEALGIPRETFRVRLAKELSHG